MNNAIYLSALLVLFPLLSCAPNAPSGSEYRLLTESYMAKSPLADAERDFERGDYSIYATMGVGMYFPGLEWGEGWSFSRKYGRKWPEAGTTDAPRSKAEFKYILNATGYAAEYNVHKIKLLKKAGLPGAPIPPDGSFPDD